MPMSVPPPPVSLMSDTLMDPIDGAVAAYKELSLLFDTYLLSTAPWENPTAWSGKLLCVKQYLGSTAYKRLILTHHKNLNQGHRNALPLNPCSRLGKLAAYFGPRPINYGPHPL